MLLTLDSFSDSYTKAQNFHLLCCGIYTVNFNKILDKICSVLFFASKFGTDELLLIQCRNVFQLLFNITIFSNMAEKSNLILAKYQFWFLMVSDYLLAELAMNNVVMIVRLPISKLDEKRNSNFVRKEPQNLQIYWFILRFLDHVFS